MLKSISLARITITLLLAIQLTVALKYESTRLDLGLEHFDSTKGSEAVFYTISVDSNLADNDLLIDSKIINGKNDFYESPLLLISTVSNLYNSYRVLSQTMTKHQNGCATNLALKLVSSQTDI